MEPPPDICLALLGGSHGQAYDLGKRRRPILIETVRAWRDYLPDYIPLFRPSPHNNFWFE